MDNNQTINFDRPIKAVALDPQFFRSGSGKHFVTGDDKVDYTACLENVNRILHSSLINFNIFA